MMAQDIALHLSIADRVSVAFHQNSIPIASEIVTSKPIRQDLAEVAIRCAASPTSSSPAVWRIERVVAGGSHHIATPDLRLDPGLLAKLTEACGGRSTLTAVVGEGEIARHRADVELLPPSHWGGVTAAPELLAAFVRPNDPPVDPILRDAAARPSPRPRDAPRRSTATPRRGRPGSTEIAEAIWIALPARGITYVLPPGELRADRPEGAEPQGEIVDRRLGTCLDLSLLYAAVRRAGRPEPAPRPDARATPSSACGSKDEAVLVRRPRRRPGPAEAARPRRARLDRDDAAHRQPPAGFAAAVRPAASISRRSAKAPFELRSTSGAPAPARSARLTWDAAIGRRRDGAGAGRAVRFELGRPPRFAEETVVADEGQADERLDRLETWKRQLLDLTSATSCSTSRTRGSRSSLECAEPARLEDLLAARAGLQAACQHRRPGRGRPTQRRTVRRPSSRRRSAALRARGARAGRAPHPVAREGARRPADRALPLARTSFEEGGSNILFLALGFLRWTRKEGGRPSRAPLLLVPVSLQRSSVRAGFRLALHEDEPRFNPTLLEMLRQDFQLRMPELEGEPLPTDASGLDVAQDLADRAARTFATFRGWEVERGGRRLDLLLHQVPDVEGPARPDRAPEAQPGRPPPRRHAEGLLQRRLGLPPPRDRLDVDYRPRRRLRAAVRGLLPARGGPRGRRRQGLRALRPARHRQEPDDRQHRSPNASPIGGRFSSSRRRRRPSRWSSAAFATSGSATTASRSTRPRRRSRASWASSRTAWHDRSRRPTAEEWEAATGELEALRDELNLLVSALHRRRGNGMTAHEAFGRVVAYRDRFADVAVGWEGHADHSAETLAVLRAVVPEPGHRRRGGRRRGLASAGRRRGHGVVAGVAERVAAAAGELAARLPALAAAVAAFVAAVGRFGARHRRPRRGARAGGAGRAPDESPRRASPSPS